MSPEISILLPTFNGARFLEKQVQSILTQDKGDFELLCVDDGSSDTSAKILRMFAERDPRVRVFESAENRGQKARLGELAAQARARFIAVADQDDVWAAGKLIALAQGIGQRAIAFGPSRIIDASGVENGLTILDLLPPQPSPDDRLVYLFKPMVSAHAAIVRREYFSALSLARAHPFDWLQSLDAIFTEGIAYVPEAITYHRLHEDNQSNAALGKLPNLWKRLAPREQQRLFNLRQTARWMLAQRLEHLMFSGLLDADTKAVFARAYSLVVDVWFGIDRPWRPSNPALARDLMDVLKPLARSSADSAVLQRYIARLSREAWNPLELAWQLGSTVRGPRLKRRRGN